LLVHGRWFSPAASTTKTGRHDIAVENGVKHNKQINQSINNQKLKLKSINNWLYVYKILLGRV
jgi:hypothetical protein